MMFMEEEKTNTPSPSSSTPSSQSPSPASSSSKSKTQANKSKSKSKSKSKEQEAASAVEEDHPVDFLSPSLRFNINDASEVSKAMDYLHENGYAVFSEVGTAEECEHAYDLFWDWVCTTFPTRHLNRNKIESWVNLPVMQTGIVWEGGVGNSSFAWQIRGMKNVKKVFEAIWEGETNLVASMDGCGVFRPTQNPLSGEKKSEWVTKGAWYHTDQNPRTKPDKCCVQGMFSVMAQNEHTGGLVVIPRSHHQFSGLQSLVKKESSSDFVRIPPAHFVLDRSMGAERPKLVHCQAGDFIVWDSRTVHCNTPKRVDAIEAMQQEEGSSKPPQQKGAFRELLSDLGAEVKNIASSIAATAASAISSSSSGSAKPTWPRLQRLVSYQCMTPFSMVNPKSVKEYRESRLEAVEQGITTNHWPHEFHGGAPHVSAVKQKAFKPVKLNQQQYELVVGRD